MSTDLQIEEALEVLNRIHAADPSVMPALIDHRVPCNRALADDPTVQVGRYGPPQSDMWEVGLLGVVNGLFGTDDQSWGWIAAHYDDEHRLTGFIRTPPRGDVIDCEI